MGFRLALGPGGQFEFVLSGNAPPLFPQVELGRWRGEDEEGVRELLGAIAGCDEPSNPPPQPDSAYVFVGHERDGEKRERLYALYEAPPGWAPVQSAVLSMVHGRWLDRRQSTLRAQASWLKTQADAARTIAVELDNPGSEVVSFSSPARQELWTVTLVPQWMAPAALDTYPYELAPHEFSLMSPLAVAQGSHALDPGKKIGVMLTLKRLLSPGRYDVSVQYLSEEVRGDARHASGILTMSLAVLEVL
jgi:hypothetical protein